MLQICDTLKFLSKSLELQIQISFLLFDVSSINSFNLKKVAHFAIKIGNAVACLLTKVALEINQLVRLNLKHGLLVKVVYNALSLAKYHL
jgi:hypothetical protein